MAMALEGWRKVRRITPAHIMQRRRAPCHGAARRYFFSRGRLRTAVSAGVGRGRQGSAVLPGCTHEYQMELSVVVDVLSLSWVLSSSSFISLFSIYSSISSIHSSISSIHSSISKCSQCLPGVPCGAQRVVECVVLTAALGVAKGQGGEDLVGQRRVGLYLVR